MVRKAGTTKNERLINQKCNCYFVLILTSFFLLILYHKLLPFATFCTVLAGNKLVHGIGITWTKFRVFKRSKGFVVELTYDANFTGGDKSWQEGWRQLLL